MTMPCEPTMPNEVRERVARVHRTYSSMGTRRSRTLSPAYLFFGNTIVWRCDQCSRMFFLSLDDARFVEIPRYISTEFGSHSCVTPEVVDTPSVDHDRECEVIGSVGEPYSRNPDSTR